MPFDFDKIYKERSEMKAGEVTIPVIPIQTLIEMKDKTDRSQDIADVLIDDSPKGRRGYECPDLALSQDCPCPAWEGTEADLPVACDRGCYYL